MNYIIEARASLLAGLSTTIELFLVSAVIAVVASVIAGALRHAGSRFVRVVIGVYVETFRGTSVVVQMFWLYFALPALGISLKPFPAAVIALGLCFGAYGSEVVRGALSSVPKHQYEAAVALNLSPGECMRVVIFPQALVAMLPGYTNILILLLKSTATASLITMPELTFRAESLNQVTFDTIPIFTTILICYFVLASIVSNVMKALERKAGYWRAPVG